MAVSFLYVLRWVNIIEVGIFLIKRRVVNILKVKKKSPQSQRQLPSDPLKAYRMGHSDGFDDAIDSAMNIMVWTLADNEFMSNEEIETFVDRFKAMLNTIESGNMSLSDIKRVLKKDYDLTVRFT